MTPRGQMKIVALKAEIDKIYAEEMLPKLREISLQSQEQLLEIALGHKPTTQEVFQFAKMSEQLRHMRLSS